jgi:Lrp/AsnC family leucine-responsive transcriptional regulator
MLPDVPANQRPTVDATDSAILQLLQADGRMTTAELARAITMSASSTADRVRRLTDQGVIRGYRAVIDAAAVGYPLTAFVRLQVAVPAGRTFYDLLENTPQILEAHHVTGEDCFLLKVIARSMLDLETITERLARYGRITTNVAFRSPVHDRPLPTCDDEDDPAATPA